MNENWFKNWFDTKYYHILYKNRDTKEAERFIDALLSYFTPTPSAKILDLACGKGRHSIYMNQAGLDVTGYDLSQNSIELANGMTQNTPRIKFAVHDMRDPFPGETFDYIFNLFTSFGYFETREEDVQVLINIKNQLSENGLVLIDYLNTDIIQIDSDKTETKILEGINFQLQKSKSEEFIVKSIKFKDGHQNFSYQEQIRNYNLDDFTQMLTAAGLSIVNTFGDYSLTPYQAETSERLILVAKRN